MQEVHNTDWFRERYVGLMLPKSSKKKSGKNLSKELLTFDPLTLNHVENCY